MRLAHPRTQFSGDYQSSGIPSGEKPGKEERNRPYSQRLPGFQSLNRESDIISLSSRRSVRIVEGNGANLFKYYGLIDWSLRDGGKRAFASVKARCSQPEFNKLAVSFWKTSRWKRPRRREIREKSRLKEQGFRRRGGSPIPTRSPVFQRDHHSKETLLISLRSWPDDKGSLALRSFSALRFSRE